MIWLMIPAMALIHRIRGGLFKLPFDLKYACPPVAGLVYWLLGAPWHIAIVWAVGYLLWIIPGYMDEIDNALEIKPMDQVVSKNWTVKLPEDLSFGDAVLSVYARAVIYLLPLLVIVYFGQDALLLLIIVAVFWPAYWIGFKLRPTDPASIAEPLVGASWGLTMALAITLPGWL